MANSKH